MGGTGKVGESFCRLMLDGVGAMVTPNLGCLLSFEVLVLGEAEE